LVVLLLVLIKDKSGWRNVSVCPHGRHGLVVLLLVLIKDKSLEFFGLAQCIGLSS